MQKRSDELSRSLAISLKKIFGMTEKIADMIDKGESCLAVVQQMDATIGLMQSARKKLVLNRLEACFRKKSKSPEQLQELVKLYDARK